MPTWFLRHSMSVLYVTRRADSPKIHSNCKHVHSNSEVFHRGTVKRHQIFPEFRRHIVMLFYPKDWPTVSIRLVTIKSPSNQVDRNGGGSFFYLKFWIRNPWNSRDKASRQASSWKAAMVSQWVECSALAAWNSGIGNVVQLKNLQNLPGRGRISLRFWSMGQLSA